MCWQNGLWGAPRIHGELLKLGVDVCQTTVAKYMVRRVGPPTQRWGTFLRNHVRELVLSTIFSRLIRSFRSLITRFTGAVNRCLTGLFCYLLSPPATTAEHIVDESASCQSILRLRHQTVIAPVGFAGCGPPLVKPLFNDSSPSITPVAVLCPINIVYPTRFRWRKVSKTIHRRCHPPNSQHKDPHASSRYHFRCRSDRLAA